jgi:hypothetical protein
VLAADPVRGNAALVPVRRGDVHGTAMHLEGPAGPGQWGHQTAGLKDVYADVTPGPRAALTVGDEADWKASLAARAVISPRSPVAAPFRGRKSMIGSQKVPKKAGGPSR